MYNRYYFDNNNQGIIDTIAWNTCKKTKMHKLRRFCNIVPNSVANANPAKSKQLMEICKSRSNINDNVSGTNNQSKSNAQGNVNLNAVLDLTSGKTDAKLLTKILPTIVIIMKHILGMIYHAIFSAIVVCLLYNTWQC